MPSSTSRRHTSNALPRAGFGAITRWLRVAVMLVGLLGLGRSSMPGAEPGVSKEYQLKAAFLYNFTKFVEWPPRHFRAADQPITIGVLGRNPFGEELEQMVKDRKVNGRALVIKAVSGADEVADIDLLFVAATEEYQLETLAVRLHQTAVLTVGESPRFLALGGMIMFVPEMDKIRFEIAVDAAEHSGLKISAQLQKLAVTVHRKR